MEKKRYLTGIGYMLLSATGLSLTGLLGKIGFSYFTLSALVFWRYFASFLAIILFLVWTGKIHSRLSFSNFKMNLLRAAFILGAQYAFYIYLKQDTLLNAVALLNTGPLFIPILERFILKRPFERGIWIALSISFFGVLCILKPTSGVLTVLGLVGLLAGLCQGASQIVFALNTQKESGEIGVFFAFLFCAASSLIPYLIFGKTFSHNHSLSWMIAFLIAGLGIASLFNQLFRAVAYRYGSPSKLAAFLYFSVLFAGFFDWIIFGLTPNWVSALGACLIVLGGVLKIYLHFKLLSQKL